MDPLTHEKLNAIERCTVKIGDYIRLALHADDYDCLIAAARASIQRPIADAPRDVILGVDAEGRWASCKYSQSSRCWFDAVGGCFFPIAFLPIPKGGAS